MKHPQDFQVVSHYDSGAYKLQCPYYEHCLWDSEEYSDSTIQHLLDLAAVHIKEAHETLI